MGELWPGLQQLSSMVVLGLITWAELLVGIWSSKQSKVRCPVLGNVHSDSALGNFSRQSALQPRCGGWNLWAMGDHLEAYINIESLFKETLTSSVSEWNYPRFSSAGKISFRLAIARDDVFQFIYQGTPNYFASRGGGASSFSLLR